MARNIKILLLHQLNLALIRPVLTSSQQMLCFVLS